MMGRRSGPDIVVPYAFHRLVQFQFVPLKMTAKMKTP